MREVMLHACSCQALHSPHFAHWWSETSFSGWETKRRICSPSASIFTRFQVHENVATEVSRPVHQTHAFEWEHGGLDRTAYGLSVCCLVGYGDGHNLAAHAATGYALALLHAKVRPVGNDTMHIHQQHAAGGRGADPDNAFPPMCQIWVQA